MSAVGSKKVPCFAINCSVSSVRYVPCSMLRTPARTAAIGAFGAMRVRHHRDVLGRRLRRTMMRSSSCE